METQLATVSNATAIYQRMADPMEAVTKMGKMFAASGMFGCTKEEQGQVLALACMVQGKDPFELMQNYYIINGSLSMKSVAVLANFIRAGGQVKWHSALNDGDQARADFEIGNNRLEEAVYTIEDAKREGLITGPNKHNWAARPADMLRARLITKAVRMIAPAIIMGANDETDAPQPAGGTAPELLQAQPVSDIKVVEAAVEESPTIEEALIAEGVPIEQAVSFLREIQFLGPEQELKDLTPATRKKVQKKLGEFIARAKNHGASRS
jgi:hypothetical protein